LTSVRSDSGFTLLELIVVLMIVALLASVAMVGVRQSRIRGAEASAVATLNAINQAQFLFMQSCGKHRYAPTLVALGTPAPGDRHGFLSPDLAVSDPLQKSGYVFQLTGTQSTEGEQTCTGLVPLDRYRLTADPTTPSTTGNHFYGTNTDRVVYVDTQSFEGNMPETGTPGHGSEIK
jgi:prepilin-type N-terminal cleavage/methylation domain-containing protein